MTTFTWYDCRWFGICLYILNIWQLTGINIFTVQWFSIILKQRSNPYKGPLVERRHDHLLFLNCLMLSVFKYKKVMYKNCPAFNEFLKHLDYTLNTVTKTLALSQGEPWGTPSSAGFIHVCSSTSKGQWEQIF